MNAIAWVIMLTATVWLGLATVSGNLPPESLFAALAPAVALSLLASFRRDASAFLRPATFRLAFVAAILAATIIHGVTPKYEWPAAAAAASVGWLVGSTIEPRRKLEANAKVAEFREMMADLPSQHAIVAPIIRRELHQKLVRVAQQRVFFVLFIGICTALVWGAIAAVAVPKPAQTLTPFVVFGVTLIVDRAAISEWRRRVKCPQCENSLWDVGTGNFKPRRIRLKPYVTCCPHCGLPIIGRAV